MDAVNDDGRHSAEARAFVSRVARAAAGALLRELELVLDVESRVEYFATDPVATAALLDTYSRRYDHLRARGLIEARNIVGIAEAVDQLRSTTHPSLRVVWAATAKRSVVIFATRALDQTIAWIALDTEHSGAGG